MPTYQLLRAINLSYLLIYRLINENEVFLLGIEEL